MLCRLYKWYISRALDAGREVPGKVRTHVSRCDSCRTFLEINEALEARLRDDDQRFGEAAPSALHGRIMAGITASEASGPEPVAVWNPAYAFAVLLVCFALAVFAYSRRGGSDSSEIAVIEPAPEVFSEASPAGLLEGETGFALLDCQAEKLVEDPINREMELLVEDFNAFKSSLGVLASTFERFVEI